MTTGRIRRALVDLLISYWLTIKVRDEVVVDSLFSDFVRWSSRSDERAADIIRELRRYADTYQRVLSTPVTTPTGQLVAGMRATNTTTPWPVLLALAVNPEIPQSQRDVAVSAIDSNVVRRGVAGKTTKDYNRLLSMAMRKSPLVAG